MAYHICARAEFNLFNTDFACSLQAGGKENFGSITERKYFEWVIEVQTH